MGAGGGYSLGIDLGTTAVKATVLDAAASVVAFGSCPTTLMTGHGGLAEQVPEGIWESARKAVAEALAGTHFGPDVRAVSLSAQGGTLILLDETGAPVCNAISWMDSRPARLGEKLFKGRPGLFYYEKTGWGLDFGCLPLAQIIRLQHEEPDTLKRVRRVRFVNSYVMEHLSGQAVSNPSDAAITMLYSVSQEQWDDELLSLAGVTREMLPRVERSGTVVGTVLGKAAAELGISPEAVVVAGGHDQYCAAYGAACREVGDTIVSCGTAWVLLTMTAEPRFHPEVRLGPARAVSGELWGLLGSCPTAGASVDWFRRAAALGKEPIAFKALEKGAASAKPSAESPVFIPPAGGEGGIVRFSGLGLHHGFGHMARAVLEGAAMSARALLVRMQAAGAAPAMLRAVGGATRSKPWMQMLSDVTGLPLEVAGVQEAAAFGVAMLAGRAAGLIPGDVTWPKASARVKPRAKLRPVYDQLFERFSEGST